MVNKLKNKKTHFVTHTHTNTHTMKKRGGEKKKNKMRETSWEKIQRKEIDSFHFEFLT